MLIGRPTPGEPSSNGGGSAIVYRPCDGTIEKQLTSTGLGSSFGVLANRIGDLTGDGIDEFVVGASGFFEAGGFVLYDGASLEALAAHSSGQFGLARMASLAGGDVDGDGVSDVLIGGMASSSRQREAGCVVAVSDASWSLLYELRGQAAGEHFGWSLAITGDLDEDGCTDFVVGSPGAHGTGEYSGKAYVVSGATGHVLRELAEGAALDGFGNHTAACGDIDRDGTGDFAICSSRRATNPFLPGLTRVYSGRTLELLDSFVGTSVAASTRRAWSEIDCLVVGIPSSGADPGVNANGVVRVCRIGVAPGTTGE